jgi:RNA polymerase sigma factor (sigma-70 family)
LSQSLSPEPYCKPAAAVFFVSHPKKILSRREHLFNPDFWEVQLDPADLDRYSAAAGVWHEDDEDQRLRNRGRERTEALLPPVLALVGRLTERQREAVMLYFLHDKTQEEVAEIMGINRRVVSQHLFGIRRNGRQVGGAIARLRTMCRKGGIAADA